MGFSPLLPTRSCYPPQADDFGGVFSKRKKKKNSLWKNSREGNLPTPLDSQAFLAAEGWIDQFTTSSCPGLVPGKDVGRVGVNREGRAEW